MKYNHKLLLEERKSRLLRLLEVKAPTEIVANECRLVLAAHYGGHIAAIRALIATRIYDKVHEFVDTWQHRLHYLTSRIGIHFKFPDSDSDCWICEIEKIGKESELEDWISNLKESTIQVNFVDENTNCC